VLKLLIQQNICIIPTETLFFKISVHKALQHVEWRAVKDCYDNWLQLLRYIAANTTIFWRCEL